MSLQVTIRKTALPAWNALQAALEDTAPPCTADPPSWFADDPEVRAEAARACRRCPVIAECAAFAAANKETFGVWAGQDRTGRVGRPVTRKEVSA